MICSFLSPTVLSFLPSMGWLCGVGVFGLIEYSHSLEAFHIRLQLIIIIINLTKNKMDLSIEKRKIIYPPPIRRSGTLVRFMSPTLVHRISKNEIRPQKPRKRKPNWVLKFSRQSELINETGYRIWPKRNFILQGQVTLESTN